MSLFRSFRPCLSLVFLLTALLGVPRVAMAATDVSPQAIEQAFQSGLRALADGDTRKAIRIFRSILAERPGLPRVRLELARAFFHAMEWERSRREFFAVLSGGVPTNVRVRILQFLRAIDARRGINWNLSVGFATSPQATRKHDSDTVLIDFFGVPTPFKISRDEDGQYGVRTAGSVEYRREIPSLRGDALRVVGFGQAFFDSFEGSGGSADDYIIGGSLGARAVWPRTTAFGSAVLSTREFGGEHFEDRIELRGGVSSRSLGGLELFASAAFGKLDDHISDFRDGTIGRLRLGGAQSLAGRANIGAALFGEHLEAEARFESYTTLGGEIFGGADLGSGINVTGRVFLLNQDFEARRPHFIDVHDAWEYGFDVGFSKPDFILLDHFIPFVSLGYSRRSSSNDAFSYHDYRVNVGLIKEF